MEFRQALRDIVISKNINLSNDESDKNVLVAFGAYCANNNEMLRLQELKNILSTGTHLGSALLQAYLACKSSGDSSFKQLADRIEEIADELEQNNISCFSYSYFISCYLDLIRDLYKDEAFAKLGIESISWIDPEKYDYGYQSMPTSEKTFGFGRYRASIKDFNIDKNKMLTGYMGKDPYVIVPYGVKSIGKGAFAGNKKIKSVYIPRSVAKIGAEAFLGCEKLETVVLSDKVTQLLSATFEECKLLKRINLSNITVVGKRCFKGCIKLEKIDMPVLTKVGDEAFSYCIGLKNMGFVSRLVQIGGKAFERCSMNYVSLEKCEKLGTQAFLNCTALTRIALSSNITSIGVAPFMGCTAVSLLNITGDCYTGYIHDLFADNYDDFNQQITELRCIKKDSLKNSEFAGYHCIREVEIRNADMIPDQAFANCSNLTGVTFGKPVREIGQSAFASCVSLTDLDIKFVGDEISLKAFYRCEKLNVKEFLANATVIGDFALAYTDLSAFSFTKSFKHIGAFAFANAKFPARVSLDLSGCETLPGAFHGVNEIAMLRVDNTSSLYKGQLHLLFDADLSEFTSKRKINYLFVNQSISAASFKDYSNIRYIEFLAEEGKIPSEAFTNCSALESIKVNGTVSLIEPYAFSSCSALSMLDMQYESIVVGRNAFSGCKHIHSLVDLTKITRFGEFAFADTDITNLTLGEKVQFVGKSAFAGCSDIDEVVIPFVGCMPHSTQPELGHFGAIFGTEERDNFNVQRIENGQDIVTYSIPSNIRHITVLSDSMNEGCFDGCNFLSELYLPNIVDFNKPCFNGCVSLRYIYLGATLANFSAQAIAGCERTVKFHIESECENYAVVNGTVMTKDKTKICFLDFADKLENHLSYISAIGTYAVAHAPLVISLGANIKEIEARAFNCAGVKSVSLNAIEAIAGEAFYNCNEVEEIAISKSNAIGAFSFNTPQPSINRLALKDIDLDCVSALFANIDDIAIDTLSLDGVSISGAEFFDKVSAVRAIEINSAISVTPECMLGANISSLAMCGQSWLVSELLGEAANLLTLSIKDAEIHSGEFKGITVDQLTLANITTIQSSAFAGANIRKLTLKSVGSIASGAFSGSHIDEIVVEDDKYKLIDGILYHDGELVYCFNKSASRILVPNFVTKVCAGSIDSLFELRQLSILHADVMFEHRAIVNCSMLNTVELVEISNKTLRELFDTVDKISFIKYSGNSIKRKFFAHMDNVCEVQLTNVSEIGDLAFVGDSNIETISGLNKVTYVGDMAFADCKAIKSIVLPVSCSHIGLGAFEGCSSLTRVTYPIDNHQVEYDISATELFGEEYSSSLNIEIVGGDIPAGYFENFNANVVVTVSPQTVGESAFKNSGLTQIALTDTAKIGIEAFTGSKITVATMPCVTHIGDGAFSDCSQLKSIVLNNAVEVLGENWIAGSPISKLSGAEFGTRYRTASNYLVDQATSTLVYIAPDSNVTDIVVDKEVIRISSSAFNGSNVVSLNVSGVMDIEECAFANCRDLVSLELRALSCGEEKVALSFFFGDNKSLKRIKIHNGELVDGCFAKFIKLESVLLPLDTKHISNRCFEGCSSLTSVDNLANVTSFGENVFGGCVSIEKLVLPFLGSDKETPTTLAYFFGKLDGLKLREVVVSAGNVITKAFVNCHSLVHVTLPGATEIITAQCFSGCSALETVSNIESVKKVEYGAFSNCTSLKKIAFAKLEEVEDGAFASCTSLIELALPSSAKQIGRSILNACTALEKLTMPFTSAIDTVAALGKGVPNSLKEVHLLGGTMGKHAFTSCDKLERIALSDSIKKIPDHAFAGCIKLQNVDCSSGITDIGEYAFNNCHELSSIELTPALATIGKDAFANSALTGDLALTGVREIGAWAFSATQIRSITLGDKLKTLKASTFEHCEALATVMITSATKSIEHSAFSGCKALSEIVLEYVTRIGDKAFFGCEQLKSVSLASIETLGVSAFEECKALETVMFNDALEVISERAFAGCKALYKINIPGQLTEIGNRAFASTAMKKLELRMPYSLVTVGEYIFESAYSPVVYVTPNQASKWNSNWGSNCKGHGLFNLNKKVITKKL